VTDLSTAINNRNAGITLTAAWIINLYTVTFERNGGSSVNQITQVNHGSNINKPADPNKNGFIFDNWYSNEGLTVVYNFAGPVTGNITLYARWIEANAEIIIGNTTVKLFLDGSATPLHDGGSTVIPAAETGTYTVSIASGTYSEIIWYLNGSVVPQAANRTSLVLTKRIPGTYQVTVEATAAGEKNTGRHYFVVE